jgi:hypothetical protein
MSVQWQDRSGLLTGAGYGHVYQLVGKAGVLYIGQTKGLVNRILNGHAKRASWWNEVVKILAAEVSEPDLKTEEAQLIHRNHPPRNRSCPLCTYYRTRPVGDVGKREPIDGYDG